MMSPSSSSVFQRLDAFSKPRQDLRSQSVVGGLITLIASTCATALFLAQVFLYIRGTPQHFLHVSHSQPHHLLPTTHPFQQRLMEQRKPKLAIQFRITFPLLDCDKLDVAQDNASYRSGELDKLYGHKVIFFRTATPSEFTTSLGGSNLGLDRQNSCTVEGNFQAPLVAGHLAVTLTKHAWVEASNTLMAQASKMKSPLEDPNHNQQPVLVSPYNISHYIHNLQFGRLPPGLTSPLQAHAHYIQEGLGLEHINVKLIPTLQSGLFGGTQYNSGLFQPSVADHSVRQATLVMQGVIPGLSVTYDITPLAVRQTLGRDHILVFLSSLISIVGGVFVSVSLVTNCLVHATAAAVSKKID